MDHNPNTFAEPLANLPLAAWRGRLAQIAAQHGSFTPLGAQHFCTFIEKGETLLVTFETQQGIRALDEDAQPLGWELVKSAGWSHLCLVSNGDTWFRDQEIYDHFDALTDEGFFDQFSNVVFYGAGPCGYAAAAFSVAAPGSTVLIIQPQATLNPEIASWDYRFTEERRRSFSGRYHYAPDMLDAAAAAFVVFDPTQTLDAMHAALFTKPHVTKLKMRHFGAALQTDLMEMQLIYRLVAQAASGTLSQRGFTKLLGARKMYQPYLRSVIGLCDAAGHARLSDRINRYAAAQIRASEFNAEREMLVRQASELSA